MPVEYKPIDELWLRSQERLALGFKGDDKSPVKWVFFNILDSEFVNATPYTLNFQQVNARGGTTGFLQLKDGDYEILDVTDNYAGRLMYHAGIGFKPTTNDLRIYTQFPIGADLGNVLGLGEPVKVGADYSYVTAQDSPFDRPTEALEFFLPYSYNLAFAFANVDRIDKIFPSANILMKEYLFEVLDPKKGDKDTKLLLSQMAHGRKKCRFKVMGKLRDPAEYLESLSKYLEVDLISLADARKLGGV